jgi:uncharacterized protein
MFSATDVVAFLACHHLSTLDRQQTEGLIQKPFFADPTIELLRELGTRHEQDYLRYLTDVQKLDVEEIATDIPWDEAAGRTNEALRRGVGAIYQATLQVGSWHGRSDFLIRAQEHSSLGNWSYEPVEAKLARSTRVGALIQLCFYSDLLAQIQGVTPKRMHVVLGTGTEPERFPIDQYLAYFRKIKRDFEKAYEVKQATYPEPTEHCNVCSWYTVCDKRWRSDDYLSLVAGITRTQRKSLSNRDVTTVARLAQLDLQVSPKFDGIRPSTLSRLHDQADLQVQGRTEGHVIYRLLDAPDPNEGLLSLPSPSHWDIFLDIEGDSFALGHGIEYLVGMLTLQDTPTAQPRYQPMWSFDLAEEKTSFAKLIGTITERWRGHPEMHVYHYASYEPTAIKRLAGRHGICVDEVDELLRAGVFVDLYRIVRQGIRASVESYSIKKIEALYNFRRAVSPRDSVVVLQAFGTAFALGSSRETLTKLLPMLEAYNQDDCLSAWKLREWLEDRRRELETKTGAPLPRPASREGTPTEGLAEQIEQVRALMDRLQSGIPTNEADWTAEHRARWLLAQILEYYRREDKSSWWEYFRQCDLSDEEVLEDGNAMGGLVYAGPIAQVKKSTVHRYKFPPQDHTIDRALNIHDPLTKAGAGTVVSIDDGLGHIDIKRSSSSVVPHPTAVIPYNFVDPRAKRDSLLRLGEWVAGHDIMADGPFQAARDLLRRRSPRELPADTEALLDGDGKITDQARKMIQSLCSQPTVLPLQGPPGSGKTHTGARMIAEVVRNGYRVGITAVSHKVISKLLQDTCKYCRGEGLWMRAVQKSNDDDYCAEDMVTQADDNDDVSTALTSRTAQLAAGTAWLWARAEMANSVDVLFVDEAGQMSLADVLSISQAATSVVLLGDPQQLNQPQKGVHPPGVDVSALAHMLDGRATIESGKGIFLNETYRLHPDICAFISELFYDNRLKPRPGNSNQRLHATGLLGGSGLRFIPVEHSANQTKSPEEVAEIARLVSDLLGGAANWVNSAGKTEALKLEDILVVAPYNAQVSALLQALPHGARVGTVDKFQGQEAPVVFYSMTTSTPEEAPRGMEFLYSLNRLNVAVSRAQCLAVVVASPALFQVECKSPHQMQLANALCRYAEMATGAQ